MWKLRYYKKHPKTRAILHYVSQKPVIFLTFANDHEGRFLESLRPEQAGIHHQLAKYQNKGEGLYHSSGASEPELLLKDLNEFTGQLVIFHFSGHSDGAGLQLESQAGGKILLHGGNLSSILAAEAKQNLHLVFLNACKTHGLLSSLKEIGVPAIIATDREVPDKEAKSFAVAFYRSLVSGNSLETAFMQSKAALEPGIERRRIFRGLEFEEEEEESDGIPWGLYIQDEKVLDWKLVDKDPLEDLPEVPLSYYQKLPKSPFRNLLPFNKKHAGIFFGRGNEIREIYHKIKGIHPLILYHGQSGVGKSSLLDAGLIPRIEEEYQVIFVKRMQDGSEQTLEKALEIKEEQTLRSRWLEIEEKGKPLVVILDQVEEVYAQKNHADADAELRALFLMLSDCFDSNEEIPAGRMILSYRKEYHAELEHFALDFDLPYTEIFLERLKRKGIVEAIEGTNQNIHTQDKYGIVLETNESGDLAGIIADDLLEDGDSALAPVLQILLSRMWDVSEDKHFSISLYQELKKEGYLLQDFFERQMGILQEKFPQEVESGLALDLLYTYTTSLGSSNSHVDEVVQEKYGHVPESVTQLLQELVNLYLLFIRKKGERSLSHDTLAPIVQKNHKISDSLGQRALRILENKSHNVEQEKALLDKQDLETVEAGALGMRSWNNHEVQLIERSKLQQAKISKQKRLIRQLGILAVGIVVFFGGLAVWQWQVAEQRGTQMESNFLASEAIALLDSEPKKAKEMAVKAWESDKTNDFARSALLKSYYNQVYEYQGETFFGPVYENFPQDSFLFPSSVYGLDHSPYADELLITFWDGSVSLYETSGKELLHFPGDGETRSRTARFAPDSSGNFAFVVADSVYVFDRKSNKKSKVLRAQGLKTIQKVAFSQDAQTLFAIGNRNLVAWNWQDNELLGLARIGPGTSALSVTSDDQIITGSSDHFTRVWKLEKELILVDSFKAHYSPITSSGTYTNRNSNDFGPELVTGSFEGEISLWDKNQRLLKTIYAHNAEVYALRFSEDGKYLISSSLDGSAKVWDMQAPYNQVLSLVGHESGVYYGVFSQHGEFAYTSSTDRSVKKWSLKANPLELLNDTLKGISGVELSLDDEELLVSNDSGNWVISTTSREVRQVQKASNISQSIFSPNPAEIINLTNDQTLEIWNREKKEIVYKYQIEDYPISLTTSANQSYLLLLTHLTMSDWGFDQGMISSEPRTLEHNTYFLDLVKNDKGTIVLDDQGKIWEWKLNDSLQSIGIVPDETDQIVISPDGKYWGVVLSTEDKSVFLMDKRNPENRIYLSRNINDVYDLAFSPNEEMLATGSEDGTLRLWNYQGEEIFSINLFSSPMEQLIFSHDADFLFMIDENGKIIKLLLAPELIASELKQ